MEVLGFKWFHAFLFSCCLLVSTSHSDILNGMNKVRAVNLGGWLVIEGWIKPSLFDGIPNKDMLDGTQVQLKSVALQKYVSAENGGGLNVSVNRDVPSLWEIFRLWRVSEFEFQFRSYGGQFLSCDGDGSCVSVAAQSPSTNETFYIERNGTRVHIRLLNGAYLQATSSSQLTADYPGKPGWDDNMATFELIIVLNYLKGDYQLANGYGPDKAKEVLTRHRSTFITAEDFSFLAKHGINTVRIPVGWWITLDSNPPAPFIGGGLTALDNAFSWAQAYGIKCIIDLHAAPGSQNGMEHSASKDGSTNWPNSPEYIAQSLDAIEFLASRYAKHPALLGIELLNEPSEAGVPLNTLISYYTKGYQIVRNYSSTAYVIICQRIGSVDAIELFNANIGSSNLVVDVHFYNLFDSSFDNLTSGNNVEFIYKRRQAQVQEWNSANGPLVFIGEWVNEMNVTNGSQADYQNFGRAQLEVYNAASFGWAYWTLKNDRKHWDFEWNIQNGYLPLDADADAGISSSTKISDGVMFLALSFGCYLFHHMF